MRLQKLFAVPLLVTGMIKRQVINKVCRQRLSNVLITGHNLDDEAAAPWGTCFTGKKSTCRKKSPFWKEMDIYPGR